MAKSYEELVGAVGRGIFFRPERKRVRDLLSRDAEPLLLVGARTFKLFDVSMNGLSFVCPSNDLAFEVGNETELTLQLYGEPAYQGRARVVRVEPARNSARVAVALTTGFLDLPEMIRKDEDARFLRELNGGDEIVHGQVPAPYVQLISRAVFMLQHYQRTLSRCEKRLKEEGVHADAEAMREVARRATDAVRPRWFALEREASQMALAFLDQPHALRAAKEYSETALTQLLHDSAMHRRAYQKPLGYPGDYQTMLYAYANDFEGESLFGKVFHKLAMEHPLAHGIRTRKDFIARLMHDEHDRALSVEGDHLHYKVSSLGCGPAREVAEFVQRRRHWPGTALWTLIDQEEETLSVAFRDGQQALSRTGARGQLNCLNLSFGQLLSDPTLLSAAPRQHFIYSTGLFDYLPEQRAQAVIGALYDRLEPGGLLAIGNAAAPNVHFWSLEFLLDWTLLYRTEAEMKRLAQNLPGSEVRVLPEPSGAYLFLLVRKV